MQSHNELNEDFLVYSDHYQDAMDQIVAPYLADRRTEFTAAGFMDRPLHCMRFDAPQARGSVVLLHGFTESALKLSEITYSLLRNRFSVLSYDQRGHGLSWRKEGLDGNWVTHVDRFDEYVRDLEIVADRYLSEMPSPHFIIAHSMGGAVAALYLERNHGTFSKAILCSPMIEVQRGGVPMWAATALCRGAALLGRGAKKPATAKAYSGHEDFAASAATGEARFRWYDDIKFTHPEYQNSNPSYSWMLEALTVTKTLLRPGAVEGITDYVHVYSAERDTTVSPQAQKEFARRLKNGRLTIVKDAKHEIYRSVDEVFFPWWRGVLKELTA